MSFDNLINPEQYFSSQQKDALNYIHLISQDYQTDYFGINYNALNRALGEMLFTKRRSWLNDNLLKSDAYKLFQTQVRTYFSLKSIVSSNLYYIYGQRATSDLQETSALKNQNYTIHNLVNSSVFYEDIKTKSPNWLRKSIVQLMIYQSRILHERQQTEQRTLAVDNAQLELALSAQKSQVEQAAEAVNQLINTAAVNQDIK